MICPNCGAIIPDESRACPECGSDEETGWSEHAIATGSQESDDEFNYQDYVKREFGRKRFLPYGISWFWWLVAILLLLAVALLLA